MNRFFEKVYQDSIDGFDGFLQTGDEIPYENIKPGMEVEDYDGEVIGTVIRKSKSAVSLAKYDKLGSEDLEDDFASQGFVAVQFMHPSRFNDAETGVYLYGSEDGGVSCRW